MPSWMTATVTVTRMQKPVATAARGGTCRYAIQACTRVRELWFVGRARPLNAWGVMTQNL